MTETNPAKVVQTEFEALRAQFTGQRLDYAASQPKHSFLQYLVDAHEILLHGSNALALQQIEPAPAYGVEEEQARYAVYATANGPEAIFFAVLARNQAGSFSTDPQEEEYRVDTFAPHKLWTDGVVYVLPKGPFRRVGHYWLSEETITPLASLMVTPADFPHLDRVQRTKLPFWEKYIFRAIAWWHRRR